MAYTRIPTPDRSHRLQGDLRILLAWLILALVTLALIAVAGPAGATGTTAPSTAAAPAADDTAASLGAAISQQVRQFALEGGALPGMRLEVEVGKLDPRLRLAHCDRIEPYLPTGARLWGRTRIGLRCTQGVTPWNVYLPLTVNVFGPGITSAAALPAGAVLTAADLQTAEVNLAERGAAIVRLDDAVGRTLARPLTPGQSVRATDLRRRQWFAAGETVQISAIGPGFRVSSEGQALGPGLEGQAARVRTESGRIVVGQPVAERRIEIDL
ncbi:MAG: flagellar basal body P-ring formation chaperone FlgA [Rhizobacter sp.]|nr:flagellar basal body P-ring formation chaperone FlgA [Rhizobacter sp.]